MATSQNYLFDSNVLIEILRGNNTLSQKVANLPKQNSFISEITVIEVIFGAYLSGHLEQELPKAKRIIELFNVKSLVGVEELFCKIKCELRKQGTPLDDYDTMIAATAMGNGFILVTDNLKHFQRIEGLQVENWTTK